MRGTAEKRVRTYARRGNASAYLVRTRGERFAQTSWSLVYQASIASKECSASVSRVSRPTWPRRDTRVVTRAKMHWAAGVRGESYAACAAHSPRAREEFVPSITGETKFRVEFRATLTKNRAFIFIELRGLTREWVTWAHVWINEFEHGNYRIKLWL